MEKMINKELPGGIRYIGRDEKMFPEKLKELSDCPHGIYVRGNLPDPNKKTVAIVGARMCSPYGRATASYFARVLAANDVQIISGLALGSDGAAHGGALLANGATFAVVAGAVDVCAEQGRDIFAVPGRLEDALSEGCNELISQGAGIAISPERMLEIMGKKAKKSDNSKTFMQNALARQENMVYSCLSLQPKTLEDLCRETKLSIGSVTESVMLLQLQGLVKEIGRNRYVKLK